MELVKVNSRQSTEISVIDEEQQTSESYFIAANTEPVVLNELKSKCVIPVFAKDNESTISHQEFIDSVTFATERIFSGEKISSPAIRVSHPVKGRIPEAMGKPAKDLEEREKTLYYERMAFCIEIPSIKGEIVGNKLSLVVGGVRAYNAENLHSRKSEERFKLFIGFQNRVCTNLCISTDGFKSEIKVRTIGELVKSAFDLFGEFNVYKGIEELNYLPEFMISESQFAQIIGRARMYQHMPQKEKEGIPQFPLPDSQISLVVKDYYADESFCRNDLGNLNLWKLYNLFTSANKMSYIDTFLDRAAGCRQFVNGIRAALSVNEYHWFMS